MMIPKVKSAKAIAPYVLEILFDNQTRKKYDVAPLLDKELFAPLKSSSALFNNVQVEQGGYAVSWNSEIDISEYELWMHGQPIS